MDDDQGSIFLLFPTPLGGGGKDFSLGKGIQEKRGKKKKEEEKRGKKEIIKEEKRGKNG